MAPRRDLLGWACFILHVAILLYVLVGWMIAWHAALVAYLVFLPIMALHWRINRNACALNNLESLVRTGHGRNPANPEKAPGSPC